MTTRVATQDVVSINSQVYRRVGPVQWFNIEQPAGKVVIGDIGDEANPLSSTWEITDLRDGIGVLVQDVRTDQNRIWWGDAQLRYRAHIVPARRVVSVAAFGTPADVGVIGNFKNQVFATAETSLELYSIATDAWTSKRTLLNSATDWLVGLVGGTETLAIATGSEVDYATDFDTWARNTADIKYLTFWQDFLWGISQAGQLYYTDDLSAAWTADAQLQLPDNYVTGLLVARGPDRNQHIYAVTRVGLYVHDNENSRFVPTDLSGLPYHPQGGRGKATWRGNIFMSAGLAVHRFQAGADTAVADLIGPDLRDGLPSDYRGSIIQLLPQSLHELLALVDATTAASISTIDTRSSGGFGSSRHSTFGDATGYSHILGWDGRGWEVKWISSSASRAIHGAVVTNAYNAYRLWWAHNQQVYYMGLSLDVLNPSQVSASEFAAASTIETPWVDLGVSNFDKLALSLFVDSTHPSTSETLKFEYATDELGTTSPTYTTIATKTATGQTRYRLPSTSDVSGVTFRYIKLKVTWARGSSVSSVADLHKAFFVIRKQSPVLYGVRVALDLTQEVNGVSPEQQMKNLLTARTNKNLVEVTWRDDRSTGNPQNYYMEVLRLQFSDEGGALSLPVGHAVVEMGEPEQTADR